jgi:hypothetical protein
LLFLTNVFCSSREDGQERLRRNGATHPPEAEGQFSDSLGARGRESV